METIIALKPRTTTSDGTLSSETNREKTTVSTGSPRRNRLSIIARRLIVLIFLIGQSSNLGANEEIPFVPTPMEVVDRMLELAEVKPGDVVYDLGSGDGRIVIRAAKRFGVKAVGIENDPELIVLSLKKANEEGVTHLVEFRHGDALQADVSPATVVTLYMFPWFNQMMRPVFQKQLKPGSRIVSHDFGIDGWQPSKVETMPALGTATGRVHHHTIYLWKAETF